MSADARIDALHRGVRQAVIERNGELSRDGTLSIIIGLGSMVFVSLLILWLTYIFWPMLDAFDLTGLSAGPAALIVTGLFLLSSLWHGWRSHSPFDDIGGMSDREFDLMMLRQAAGLPTLDDARLAIAGFADLVIGGPRQLFDGIAELRRRLPSDAMTVGIAATMLLQAMSPEHLDIATVTRDPVSRRALAALRRLSLIVPSQSRASGRHLMATRRAEAFLTATAGSATPAN